MGTEDLGRRGRIRPITVAATLLTVVAVQPLHAVSRVQKHAPAPTIKLTSDADGIGEHLRTTSLTSFAPPLIDTGKFSFTAPGQTAANARLQTVERAFRFTPSGKPDNRRALSFGVTSRVTASATDTSRAAAVPVEVASATPAAYNVDLAVGWRGFAVSGGYSRSEALGGTLPTSLTPKREGADVGVSYRGKNWKTSLQLATETGSPVLLTPLPTALTERQYSVELGGAYLLTPKLSVNGGVRYKVSPGTDEALRNDQSIYLGTAFSF